MDRLEQFRRKAKENPDNLLFRFSLGQALFDAGDFSEAEEHLHLCLEQRSDWMVALLLRGRCLMELKRDEEAAETLRGALQAAREQHHEDPEQEALALLAQLETV